MLTSVVVRDNASGDAIRNKCLGSFELGFEGKGMFSAKEKIDGKWGLLVREGN